MNRSILALAAALACAIASPAHAQSTLSDTGYELALSGPSSVRADRDAHFRGVAYRVRGLAELSAYEGRVRARYRTESNEDAAWLEVRSDARGRFELVVPIDARSDDAPRIEVEVGPDDGARVFEFPVTVEAAWELDLRTDRNLYEPGEPVHVWMLVRDTASGAPAAGRTVRFELAGAPIDRREEEVTTSEAGVAHLTLALAEAAREGSVDVRASVDGASDTASFRVGQRTWERLFARIEMEPREVAPGGSTTVSVRVTTPDAMPVRGATVDITVGDGAPERVVTSDEGEARLVVRAPAYLSNETGYTTVVAHVSHPAHGSVDARAAMRVAVPLALSIEVVPAHGALVPEIDDVIFVQLEDALGEPPPPGTEVEVEGAAIPGGRARASVDENGLAQVAVRLPRGASSGGEEEGGDGAHATLRVHVLGAALARTARFSVPVRRGPEVVPTVMHPLVEPGAVLEIRLARRPDAARRPILVELLDGTRGEPLAFTVVAAGAPSVRLVVPAGQLGRLFVRARAIREDESLEGVGASDALLVRPPAPDFVTLTPVRPRWRVGEVAQLELHTSPGGPRAWGAVLVRDLAAHGGESDFAQHFLHRAFERALLEPSGATGERLLRAALASSARVDPPPPIAAPLLDELGLPRLDPTFAESSSERGVLRDPWPLARELARRGAGSVMLELEGTLGEALANGTLDEITEVRGGRRRFRADLLDGSDYVTLGAGPMTPAMLEAVDPSFSYDNVARRVARVRLVLLLSALAGYLDPGDEASIAARTAAREPWTRWLQRMIERGAIDADAVTDPWGGRFALRAARAPSIVLSANATSVELVSPGPDGRLGTADDVRDPFARAVPAGTPYAIVSGEDVLMRRLAILSPVERTLAAIRDAYTRISAEMSEDLIGDAVHASVSEGTIGLGNLGTIGHGGGGGGSGSGYGSGAGGFSGRRSVVPNVRSGGANLARLVRERFPPTISFRPSIVIDPSGTTRLDVPLADAVTSYRVEVIVWREDGWIWSARAEISSDRDIVIDAPIPGVARLGDRLELPVRVQNRGTEARELVVQVLGDPTLGIEDSTPTRITVPAGSAVQVPVTIAPTARGEGGVRVVASDPSGEVLDAVRRPLRVVAPARAVQVMADALVEGNGELVFEVEDGADPLDGRLRIAVGAALFAAPTDPLWSAWSTPGQPGTGIDRRVAAHDRGAALGFEMAAAYVSSEMTDEQVRRASERLADALARGTDATRVTAGLELRAWALLGLAPAARALAARPGLAADTGLLVERMVRELGDGAVAIEDDPELVAVAAAALGWAGGERARPRVAELVRRLDRSIVEVGDDVWLATATRPLRSTVLLAMAELALEHRARAFALLATVARWQALGHRLQPDEAGLARGAAARLSEGSAPTSARLVIDGVPREVALDSARAEIDVPELATAGRHRIEVSVDGSAPVLISASSRFGVPWDRPPPRPGPFALELVGETGARDDIAELELVVVNRSPRWITAPIVEIELPTGVELPELEHDRIRRAVRSSTRSGATLTLTLRSLPPGAEARVPLPVRWSLAGTLRGFGVAARAADRPDAVTVLPPNELRIEGADR